MANSSRRKKQEFEDLSSYSSSTEYKKHRKNRKNHTAAKVTAGLLFSALILIGGAMIYISTTLLSGLTTNAITKDPTELGISASAIMDENVTNIAVFGVDSRGNTLSGQSDVVMIVTVDNKHGKIKLASVLRDSRVSIEGETSTGEHVDWNTKINAAYAIGGPELAIRTLNRNFGLDIRDYVTLNFANMASIIDAFDGVDVRLTAEEVREINLNLWNLRNEVERQKESDAASGESAQGEYPEITNADYLLDASGGLNLEGGNYVGGVYHLNGNQAVSYGRIRNVGSDYMRVDRQQVVFSLLMRKVMDQGLGDYTALIRQLMPYCETSLDLSGIIGLTPILGKGFTMESVKLPDLEHETDVFDGLADDGIYYVIYDLDEASQRLNSFIYEDDSPYWELYGNTGKDAYRDGTS